jgi:hypothetical protein
MKWNAGQNNRARENAEQNKQNRSDLQNRERMVRIDLSE